MADSSSTSFNNTHLQDPNTPSFSSSIPPKSKFHLRHFFLSKSVIIILVLVVFSFFPTQVPDFFKKSAIVNKLWELFYLLIMGIAVCYGLFSRKMDRIHSCDEVSHFNDNNGARETYLTGISHISSIFEDGIQSSYGFDEKDLFEECKGSGSRLSQLGNGFGKSDENHYFLGESQLGNGFGKSDENHYFLGESMVVINDQNYVLEQLSKPKTIKQNKPLCLDSAAADKSSNGVVNDSLVCGNGIKDGKFRGLVPIKLEEKFKETDSDSTNWRSKSMRLQKREDSCTSERNESCNIDPLLDFQRLRSKSMRFSMPSQINKSSEKVELETNHDVYMNNGETTFGDREFSISTCFEKNNHLSCKDSGNHGISKEILNDFGNHGSPKEILKDFGIHGSCKEILKDYGNRGSCKEILNDFGKTKVVEGDSKNKALFIKSNDQRSSIDLLMNLETFEHASDLSNSSTKAANTYKRGKSVRTNRPKEQVIEAKVKILPNQTQDKAQKLGTDVNLDDTEPHSGEVDRKAEEFIAKFREQIRLQQAPSATRLNL